MYAFRANGKPSVFIRLSIERFTHEGIYNLCHDFQFLSEQSLYLFNKIKFRSRIYLTEKYFKQIR